MATSILAWSMALLLTALGATGAVMAIWEFIYVYREFSYIKDGYWWKHAINWKRTTVSLTIITLLIVTGVFSVLHLLSGPA